MMQRPKPRAIKIPTPARLQNIALHYLSRYAASEASLRRVLQNRLRRAAMAHPAFAADKALQAQLSAAIERIVESHKKAGSVNDASLAVMKVASLRRSGRSQKFIRQKLGQKGLHSKLVANALDEHDSDAGGEAELKAALAYARRRRLGSFRPATAKKPADPKKDFAALARAGFGAGTIRAVLALGPDEMAEYDDNFIA